MLSMTLNLFKNISFLFYPKLPNFNQKKEDFIDRMERGGMGMWNAKENGNSGFPSPGADGSLQSLRNQLSKSG